MFSNHGKWIVVNNKEGKNIKLIIAYDGTGYFGWQRQLDQPTIQGTIEEKIEIMVGKHVSLIASGRTDTGVHALHQVANFIVSSTLTPSVFLKGLNSLLPNSIIIKDAEYVSLDFHARYDAKSKVYEYRIHNDKTQSPFLRHYAWHILRVLDLKAMEECLEIVKGIHDFSSFYSAGDGKIDPTRNMIQAGLNIEDGNLLSFNFEANGFLRHMVRNIMGTVVQAGLGEISTTRFIEILESKDRQDVGAMAPPGGLYLKDVRY
ncbi:MAG: tRNA pseudouridine(38-40) synthase TruA [Deltaproteobacteria bacterium]|jgi:tRNA pseudouridine38-40 synthase|nr:MAG: tRNA pseudouridine(38-40) synthase TruA [Deltaproteobacteria bacterium]